MAEEVQKRNVNNILLPEDMFSLKKEIDEDCCIDDKVCVTETTISASDGQLKDCIRNDILKQLKLSTLDMKMEPLPELQNSMIDNVIKTEFEVDVADDIKNEIDGKNELLYPMQCPFCKIYLGKKEYSEHHMIYCSERNARKCIPPTSGEQMSQVDNLKTRHSRHKSECESNDAHSDLCRVGSRSMIDTYNGFAERPAGLYNEWVCPSDTMDDDLKYIALLGLLYLRWKRRNKKNRRMWVHPNVNDRLTKGQFYTLFAEIREDEEKFFNFTRMSMASFNELLGCIKEKITKKNTRMRSCIPPEEKLVITLRYLATGCSLSELHHTFRVGRSTTSCIIKEVCEAIWITLEEATMPPLTTQQFLDIAEGFEKCANFPNVIGAIDGKHIPLKQTPHSDSMYFNYKGYLSTVLLAMCDTNYCFTYVEMGSYDKSSDEIFENSKFFHKLRGNSLGIPPPRFLPNSTEKFPYVILGGEDFPLSENLLRPYGGKHLAEDKQIFNNRLFIARQYVECTFGILTNKWRIFHRPIDVDIDFADSIVKAACVLHNFVRTRDGVREESFRDTNVRHSMQSLQPRTRSRSNSRALSARDKYASYFSRN